MPRGETVERSLFSLWLSCTINNLQAADGCARPSNDVQIGPILGWIVGCGSGPSAAILQASEEKGQTGMGVLRIEGKMLHPYPERVMWRLTSVTSSPRSPSRARGYVTNWKQF